MIGNAQRLTSLARAPKSTVAPSLLAVLALSCSSTPKLDPNDLSGPASGGADTNGGANSMEGGGASAATGGAQSNPGGQGPTGAGLVISDDDSNGGAQNSDLVADAGAQPDPADAGEVVAPPMLPDYTFVYERPKTDAGACATVKASGTLESRPVDIIVSVDNSGSMNSEIQAIEDRINGDFAQILEASGIDYRFIMVSRYGYVNQSIAGSNNPICIGPPLGNAACDSNDHPMLVNAARFFHHSTDIESRNMWCRLLESYDGADEVEDGGDDSRSLGEPHFPWQPLAACSPADGMDCMPGWQRWLRADSFKVFLGITDDSPGGNGCNAYTSDLNGAKAWDQALRTRSAGSAAHFGTYSALDPSTNRNYAWYSIVGMKQVDLPGGGVSKVPLAPTDPIVTQTCEYQPPGGANNEGEAAGQGYQHLSVLTGGLRYPSCLVDNFDAVFNAVADQVIERSEIQCDFPIPKPAKGSVNFENIQVEYQPSVGAVVPILRVATEAECTANNQYYFDNNAAPKTIQLCPATCARVQSDEAAKLGIDLGCLGI